MRDYDEVTNTVLKRRDAQIAKRKHQMYVVKRSAAAAFSLCIVSAAGIGIWKNNSLRSALDDHHSSNVITETTGASEPTAAAVTEYTTQQTTAKANQQTAAQEKNTVTTAVQKSSKTTPYNTSAVKSHTVSTVPAAETVTEKIVSGNAKETQLPANTVPTQRTAANAVRTTSPVTTVNIRTGANTFAATSGIQTSVYTVTSQSAVTTISESERSNYMKKIVSMLSAAVMMSSIVPYNSNAVDTEDPVHKYAANIYSYYEPANQVNPAEQELFDRIDKGLIDIDIDRNGELDMRDAALLWTYEECKFAKQEDTIANEGYADLVKIYKYIDFHAPSEESMEFLETREPIRDKEFFSQSRYYPKHELAVLDAYLIMRYHLINTFKSEYLDASYYSDVIGYPYLDVNRSSYNIEKLKSFPEEYEKYANQTALGGQFFEFMNMEVRCLGHLIKERITPLSSDIYDFNGDGTFDLHDIQDYSIFFINYDADSIYKKAFVEHLNEPYDFSKYISYSDTETSISEETWNRCLKYLNHDADLTEELNTFTITYPQKLISLYFEKNNFKLVYLEPDYYTSERPGSEGMPIDKDLILNYYIERYAAEHGLVTTRLTFNQEAFDKEYLKWTDDLKNGKGISPDVDGDGKADIEDYRLLDDFVVELFANTPAEESELPEGIREFLDTEFDINNNGISGDIHDAMAGMAYIMANDPSCFKSLMESNDLIGENYESNLNILSKLPIERSGDANCDNETGLADALIILQNNANSEKYPLNALGKFNADVYETGNGLTPMDALEIQKWDAEHKI